MTTQVTPVGRAPGHRLPLATMWGGLVLTVIATGYPFVDRATTHVLADHIRAGYPSYAQSEIDRAVTAYLVILSIVGGLGILSWIGTMWATHAGKRWARWAAAGVFVVALCVALAGVTVKDTSGDVGLAPSLGWLQFLPCVLGLATVALLWKRHE